MLCPPPIRPQIPLGALISWFERELTGGLKNAPHSGLAGYQSSSDRPLLKRNLCMNESNPI